MSTSSRVAAWRALLTVLAVVAAVGCDALLIDRAPPPPAALTESLANRGIGLTPADSRLLEQLRTRRPEAVAAALSSQPDPVLGPWTEVGFVYVGMFTEPAVPRDSPPSPRLVYVVQVNTPANGLTGTSADSAIVAIDAVTGAVITVSSPCVGPLCLDS
jgi:hypothetical protein